MKVLFAILFLVVAVFVLGNADRMIMDEDVAVEDWRYKDEAPRGCAKRFEDCGYQHGGIQCCDIEQSCLCSQKRYYGYNCRCDIKE
uniref:U23-Deinotoxin-Dsu1b_1 n=1 Tax=Deinopis subrufa TaxID=1905329 RepID=A0A4Q8K9X4_DEISU